MKIKDKIRLGIDGLAKHGPINIVIFGDSVSHGAVNGYFDYENVYWNLLRRKLDKLGGTIPVNTICAAIGGYTAELCLPMLEKRVLSHDPDLVIVCFGLNDVNGELEQYLEPLRETFRKCLEFGTDVIFMTPNMLNTSVADDTPAKFYEYAHKTARMQNEGRMDKYIYAAVDLAKSMGVTVCDCYSKWKKLSETQDITYLLANRINHPTSEMHHMFADSLYELIIGEEGTDVSKSNAMYEG